MEELFDILQWREVSTTPTVVRRAYEAALEAKFYEIFRAESEDDLVHQAFSYLDAECRISFLRSPQVATQLIGAMRNRMIDRGLVAELLLLKLYSSGVADAAPDFEYPVVNVISAQGKPALVQSLENAPDKTVEVDFDSGENLSSDVSAQLTCLDESEKKLASEKLLRGVATLNIAAPAAHHFWKENVDIVALRKSKAASKSLWSTTSAQEPRISVLSNLHLEEITVPLVTEAVLHESIHSQVFSYEIVGCPLIRELPDCTVRLTSPWSGKLLRPVAFVHASLVWYGLYWFWKRSRETEVFHLAQINKEMSFAAAGFGKHPYSIGLKQLQPYLSHECKNLLLAVESSMISELESPC